MSDAFANVNLRGEDSWLVLNRGFVEKQGKGGVMAQKLEMFNTDSIDSHLVVKCLAAALSEEKATYFFTQTCNQSDFFGVRELKHWLDGNDFRDELLCGRPNLTYKERQEVVRAGMQCSCVPISRNWMEAAELYMHYIAKSPERPLGGIRKIWCHEYQESEGNLSHIHCLLWTDDDSEEVIDSRIHGSNADLIPPDEIDELMEEGLMSDRSDVYHIRNFACKVLFHSCSSRCQVCTGPGNSDFKCRVPSAVMLSPTPTHGTMVKVEPHHSDEALAVLKRLGLCMADSTGDHFVELDEKFRCEHYFVVAMPGKTLMSLTNGQLFVATMSQQNLQWCTSYMSARYLAKYVAGIDETNRVYVRAGTDGMGNKNQDGWEKLVLDQQFTHNSKIASSAMNEKLSDQKMNECRFPKGRAIALTEIISLLLKYPQVYTNLDFENLPTMSLEHRPGFDKVATLQQSCGPPANHCPGDLVAGDFVEAMQVCNAMWQLPLWWQFTESEQLILLNNLYSTMSVDKTTVFGMRPPELQFVNNQRLYYQWFHRSKPVACGLMAVDLHKAALSLEYAECGWVDGLNATITLQPRAIPEILAYVNGCSRGSDLQFCICFIEWVNIIYAPLCFRLIASTGVNGRICFCARWTSHYLLLFSRTSSLHRLISSLSTLS